MRGHRKTPNTHETPSPTIADLKSSPPRRMSVIQMALVAGVAAFVLEALGPTSLKPSMMAGNAMSNFVGAPKRTLAEIERCTMVIANLMERQEAHTARVANNLSVGQVGLMVRSMAEDTFGGAGMGRQTRQQIVEEQNLAEEITRLQEYKQLLQSGGIHPRGEC